MNPRAILQLRTWPDLAIETAARLGGLRQPLGQSCWPLPPGLRDRVTVCWPRDYGWHFAARWGNQLRDILRRRVNIIPCDIPQNYKGTIQSEFRIEGRAYKVAFNYSDYPDFIDPQSTRESLVTFKLQFREQGYSEPNIVPGGYLPASSALYAMLPYLRWSSDHRVPRFEVYGRFGMEFSPGVRGEALRRLAHTDEFRFCGGNYLVRYSRYVREVAHSEICIDLPGQGPLCFRLIEYLAIGSCIVARPHGVRFPAASLIDGVHIAQCSEDSEMVRLSRALLDDPARRRAMALAARTFFDRYLHRDQLSAYYLATALAVAGAS